MPPAESHFETPDPLFVGESRHKALMQLESAYRRTIQEHRPSLVVISGIAGSGKTRLVQEFFNRLASSQPEPRYWPTHFLSVTLGTSLLKSRNLIHPQEVSKSSATRTFSWYAQTCRRAADDPDLQFQSAVESHRKLIDLHPKRKVQRLSAYFSAAVVASALTVEFLDNYIALPSLLQWCARVAGLVSFGWSLREFFTTILENRHGAQKSKLSSSPDPDSALSESLNFIRTEVERFKTPTVIVIDEWHAADLGTQSFVESLLTIGGPCFVILTRWLTGGENSGQSAQADSTELKAIASIELPGLEVDEIVQILEFEKPEFPTILHRAIAKHSAGNPLIALKLCYFPQVLALALDNTNESEIEKTVGKLPFDHEGVLKEQWRAVPLEVQQFLSIASVYGEVIPTHLAKTAFSSFFKSDPARALKLARDPYWWLQILQADIDMFPDSSLYRIAKDEARFVLGNEKLSQLESRVATIDDSHLPEGLRLFGIYGNLLAEQKMIRRVAGGVKTQSIQDAELVWRSVFTLGGSRFRELRLELCREQIEWLSNYAPSPEDAELRSSLLTQFRYYEFKSTMSDDPTAGRDLGQRLLEDIGSHPLRADLLLRLGNLSVNTGDYQSAETYYSLVLAERPPDHIAEAASANRLLVLSRTGRTREAIRCLKKVRRRKLLKVRVLGPLRPLSRSVSLTINTEEEKILTCGNNIGSWLGWSGEPAEAVKYLRAALGRGKRLQQTSENLEKLWRCRSVLGYWAFKSGDARSSMELLSEITADRTLISRISPDHIEVVSACQTLAAVEAYLGDISNAHRRLRQLAEPDTPSGIRLSKDPSLQDRQDFVLTHLDDPEALMRNL